ncbi:MAG: ferredoxin [Desulfobulbaceae bacterium]|nr:ferredoxin [Desulfobulbaceae bacterium]
MRKKFPTLDLGLCSDCGCCIEIVPEVFRYNESIGMIEVVDLKDYPERLIDEAIKNCPKDCIIWDEFV